jgi:hypothetical protein
MRHVEAEVQDPLDHVLPGLEVARYGPPRQQRRRQFQGEHRLVGLEQSREDVHSALYEELVHDLAHRLDLPRRQRGEDRALALRVAVPGAHVDTRLLVHLDRVERDRFVELGEEVVEVRLRWNRLTMVRGRSQCCRQCC